MTNETTGTTPHHLPTDHPAGDGTTDPRTPEPGHTTLVMAASTRVDSINAALARRIVRELVSRGEQAAVIDLDDHDMPMYHGDLEADAGVPRTAHELADRLAGADRLVIVSPEYNGAFPPLLKNTIDWVSRVDREALRRLDVHLASATPGGGGGRRVLDLLRTWMEHMRVPVAEPALGVPHASLDDGGELATAEPLELGAFLDAVTAPPLRRTA